MGQTDHDTLYEVVDRDSEVVDEGRFSVEWADTYKLLKCRGCGSMQMQHSSWFSEAPDEIEVRFYPPIESRRKPDWLNEFPRRVPSSLIELLNEIYEALHSGSRRLASMGIRSLIETIMIEKVGDEGSFAKNLANLKAGGWTSTRQHEVLEKIVEAGHAATHRSYVPAAEDLKTLMDTTEALLASVYVHPQRGAELQQKIPPRK